MVNINSADVTWKCSIQHFNLIKQGKFGKEKKILHTTYCIKKKARLGLLGIARYINMPCKSGTWGKYPPKTGLVHTSAVKRYINIVLMRRKVFLGVKDLS
uniref:Uncharacterized protein n=1 Tax=Lepeophtheirus salmonis TaxID=72036 RepID=A0A0K2TBF2_LEPSM